MLIFDIEPTSEKEQYPPSSSASARSRESKENLPENVLVVEEENVVQEAKSKVESLLHRVTAQLARWGLEVNG